MHAGDIQRIACASTSKGAARTTLLVIALHINPEKKKWILPMEQIALEAGLSKRGAEKAVARLRELGEIEVEAGGGRGLANTYRLGPKLGARLDALRTENAQPNSERRSEFVNPPGHRNNERHSVFGEQTTNDVPEKPEWGSRIPEPRSPQRNKQENQFPEGNRARVREATDRPGTGTSESKKRDPTQPPEDWMNLASWECACRAADAIESDAANRICGTMNALDIEAEHGTQPGIAIEPCRKCLENPLAVMHGVADQKNLPLGSLDHGVNDRSRVPARHLRNVRTGQDKLEEIPQRRSECGAFKHRLHQQSHLTRRHPTIRKSLETRLKFGRPSASDLAHEPVAASLRQGTVCKTRRQVPEIRFTKLVEHFKHQTTAWKNAAPELSTVGTTSARSK